MRTLIQNVVTPELRERLLKIDAPRGQPVRDAWEGAALEIAEIVKQHAPVRIGGQSYWNLESRSKGHLWHFDGCTSNLTPNHMPWCRYSAVTLLTAPWTFEGGAFMWEDGDQHGKIKDELFGSIFVYSSAADNSPLWHQATPHNGGERWMFLMFFEGTDE